VPAGVLLRLVHDGALIVWIGALLIAQVRLVRARRRGGKDAEADVRRRLGSLYAAEHLALGVALGSGALLMWSHGWRVGHPRWLGVKLGLVAFVVVPLEGMHAWVNHVWIPRALRARPPSARELERWTGMDDMVRTLAALLFAVVLPLAAWLSLRRPF
jgi:hypothetical protein